MACEKPRPVNTDHVVNATALAARPAVFSQPVYLVLSLAPILLINSNCTFSEAFIERPYVAAAPNSSFVTRDSALRDIAQHGV